jgi:diguanylate cyclase (GGDEF)-like protein/PAS domain S-box-containing protein
MSGQDAIIPEGLALEALAAAPEGIVIVDAVQPGLAVRWVNSAFERLSGYTAGELVGGSLRVLQGGDGEQAAVAELNEAIRAGRSCEVVIRNYRPDGTLWWNRLAVAPLCDPDGRPWWVGFALDVTAQREMEIMLGHRTDELDAARQRLAEADPVDRLTGLQNERSFEVSLELAWFSCARDGRSLTLFLFAPDAFDMYLETFGRVAGDSAVRMLARAVGSAFRRSSDVTARLGDAHFAALGVDMERAFLEPHARRVCDRVHALAIRNPRAPLARNLTMSAAIVLAQPTRSPEWRKLLSSAREALAAAQAEGVERVVVVA